MYYAIMGIVFFATFAMMVREGIWNNVINLISIVLAGLISFGSFQPMTRYIDEQLGGSYTYMLDFVILWFLFTFAITFLKVAAKACSPKRVLFLEQADTFGGMAIGLIAGVLMTGIVMASIHCAPLEYDLFDSRFVMGKSLDEVKSKVQSTSVMTRPDLLWLGLTENTLNGGSMGGSDFSAARYIHTYAEHRRTFAETSGYTVKRN